MNVEPSFKAPTLKTMKSGHGSDEQIRIGNQAMHEAQARKRELSIPNW
jgi:hypothetical protein